MFVIVDVFVATMVVAMENVATNAYVGNALAEINVVQKIYAVTVAVVIVVN